MSLFLRRAIALVVVALVVVACDPSNRPPADGAASNPPVAVASPTQGGVFRDIRAGWTELPSPPEVRTSAAIGWTGQQLIVWGGYVYSGYSDESAESDGFAFDVPARRWETIAPPPLSARTAPAAAWTGTELLVWGGSATPDLDGFLADGAAYNPVNDAWRRLPPAPLSARAPLHVWTGRELIVWGTAVRLDERPRDGAAYDPVANEWRPIAEAPIELTDATASWTGREMIVFGAALHGGNKAETETAIAAAYDPARHAWRRLPPSPLSPQASTAAWNGRELIAWDYLNASAAYDPRTDEWRRLPRVPLDSSECSPRSVAVGHDVVGDYCGSMALFDRSEDRWRDLSRREQERFGFTVIAAGPVALLMGRNVDSLEEAMFAYRPLGRGRLVSPRGRG